MKIILTLLLINALTNCISQSSSFVQYKDTINHFEINIPPGWRYGVNKSYPELKLIAYRTSTDTSDKPGVNFNLNIIKKENSSLDKEYKKLMDALMSTNDFTLTEKDSININGLPYKWFIEAHKNEINKEPMINYVFITYKEGKTFILTFIAFSEYFKKYRPLFYKIAGTLIL
jgi:hypothetical protein